MSSPRAKVLAALVVPAAVVGAVSAVTLIGLSVVSNRLEHLLWDTVPDALDVSGDSGPWIIAVLSVVGLVVGLLVWILPGHAGPDPATQSLVSAPLAPSVLPGLAVVVIVGLGGGVSLGPENPIVAINVGLAVWLGRRAVSGIPVPGWVGLAAAGTIGAMFGTPVGAALVLGETNPAPGAPSLWDRLFGPVTAAATGALVMDAFGQPILSVSVAAYPGPHWDDLVSGPVIALIAAVLGLTLVYIFPLLHAAFWKLRHPILMLTVGGVVLGILGAIGGKVTLFKGLDEMKELATSQLTTSAASPGRLVVIIVVKLLALVIAASCGFRGGRIFPAVFVGVAIGLLSVELVDGIPPSLAIAAGVLGILAVVTRSGWLSLFMAVTTVGQIELLPVLCITLLPVWLLVTDRPELLIEPAQPTPQPSPARPI